MFYIRQNDEVTALVFPPEQTRAAMSIIDNIKLGVSLHLPLQEAVDEANAHYELETKHLCYLVVVNRTTELEKALEGLGCTRDPKEAKDNLILQYEAIGLERTAAIAQADKHIRLQNNREKAIMEAVEQQRQWAEREREWAEWQQQWEERERKVCCCCGSGICAQRVLTVARRKNVFRCFMR